MCVGTSSDVALFPRANEFSQWWDDFLWVARKQQKAFFNIFLLKSNVVGRNPTYKLYCLCLSSARKLSGGKERPQSKIKAAEGQFFFRPTQKVAFSPWFKGTMTDDLVSFEDGIHGESLQEDAPSHYEMVQRRATRCPGEKSPLSSKNVGPDSYQGDGSFRSVGLYVKRTASRC